MSPATSTASVCSARVLPDDSELFYHYDSRGSTIGLTDSVGNVIGAYSYDSFGALLERTGVTANPFTYIGRHGVVDDGDGLAYVRARYYAPATGRFLTKDPHPGNERNGQSLHRYIYALNNPIGLVDVSGFSASEGLSMNGNGASSDYSHQDLVDDVASILRHFAVWRAAPDPSSVRDMPH